MAGSPRSCLEGGLKGHLRDSSLASKDLKAGGSSGLGKASNGFHSRSSDMLWAPEHFLRGEAGERHLPRLLDELFPFSGGLQLCAS